MTETRDCSFHPRGQTFASPRGLQAARMVFFSTTPVPLPERELRGSTRKAAGASKPNNGGSPQDSAGRLPACPPHREAQPARVCGPQTACLTATSRCKSATELRPGLACLAAATTQLHSRPSNHQGARDKYKRRTLGLPALTEDNNTGTRTLSHTLKYTLVPVAGRRLPQCAHAVVWAPAVPGLAVVETTPATTIRTTRATHSASRLPLSRRPRHSLMRSTRALPLRWRQGHASHATAAGQTSTQHSAHARI